MASAVLRAAGPADADVVGRLLRDFNDEFDTPGPDADDFSRRFHTLLDRPDILLLLAENDTHPVGFAYLTLRPTPYYDGLLAQLEELYVHPDLRDQGIGTKLLLEAVDAVRASATILRPQEPASVHCG